MTPRKKPAAGFWITVALVAVLVGYPLSIGPVRWAMLQKWCPSWVTTAYPSVYSPLRSLLFHKSSPQPIRDALKWYCRLWLPD
jgi:hypothetical protein